MEIRVYVGRCMHKHLYAENLTACQTLTSGLCHHFAARKHGLFAADDRYAYDARWCAHVAQRRRADSAARWAGWTKPSNNGALGQGRAVVSYDL